MNKTGYVYVVANGYMPGIVTLDVLSKHGDVRESSPADMESFK